MLILFDIENDIFFIDAKFSVKLKCWIFLFFFLQSRFEINRCRVMMLLSTLFDVEWTILNSQFLQIMWNLSNSIETISCHSVQNFVLRFTLFHKRFACLNVFNIIFTFHEKNFHHCSNSIFVLNVQMTNRLSFENIKNSDNDFATRFVVFCCFNDFQRCIFIWFVELIVTDVFSISIFFTFLFFASIFSTFDELNASFIL